MRVADFSFDLPDRLIAHYPSAQRSASRLLSLDGTTGQMDHGVFTDVLTKIHAGDLLVFNDTRVIPARIYGRKQSGGKIEMLVERIVDDHHALVHIRASKVPKAGTLLQLGDDYSLAATVIGRHGDLFRVVFHSESPVLSLLEQIGHIPLPPYVKRPDEAIDRERYQTVYNRRPGAVAAPTAGLHFDQPLLTALKQRGVDMAFITLHVGAGTFQPVRVATLDQHIMHAEFAEVPPQVVEAVLACKARGNRVIAVGTTSLRSLESAAQASERQLIAPFSAETSIFIYPGFRFRIVDALITNFHLPESTLMMLVSAFAGYHHIIAAYQTAVAQQYRFYSYGDAMFITRDPSIMSR